LHKFCSKFGTKKTQPLTINCKSDKVEIANEFANYFAKSCSCNSETRKIELQNEFEAIKSSCDVCYLESDYLLSVDLVNSMNKRLHLGKAAGIDGLTVEPINHCHPIIVLLLTKLFNLMKHFNYVPHAFGIGLTIPIPKGDTVKNAGSTSDYRV